MSDLPTPEAGANFGRFVMGFPALMISPVVALGRFSIGILIGEGISEAGKNAGEAANDLVERAVEFGEEHGVEMLDFVNHLDIDGP